MSRSAVERGRQPLRQRGIGRRQIVEIVAQALDAHLIEDAAGEDAALGEVADVGQRSRARRVRDRGRDLVAVLRQQHLRERAETLGLFVATAGVAGAYRPRRRIPECPCSSVSLSSGGGCDGSG